jgi:cytochrome c
MRQVLLRTVIAGVVMLPPGLAFALDGDAAKGETVFKQCMTCHRVGEGATNLVGPVLNNVIGRQAGTFEGYTYSDLNKNAGANGLVWSEDLIKEYLVDPTAFLKKYLTDKGHPELAKGFAKMPFRLANEQQRADVIAYLEQFSKKK